MSLDKDYGDLTLEEQAQLHDLLSHHLTDADLKFIAGGISNENIKKVLSYGIAALTGAGLTAGGMTTAHLNHPQDGNPHPKTHFSEHENKHHGMPKDKRHDMPKREHQDIPKNKHQHQR